MSLKKTQAVFEEYGDVDPLYAVLSSKDKQGNKWDVEEFFETGRASIAKALQHIESLKVPLHRRSALDFGCGVGRLTQALAEKFEAVSGVDISSSMIDKANSYNKAGDSCTYFVNTTDDLALFEDKTFDFVYTELVLQHMHPKASSRYISEFFRVLRPGGVTLFQIPSGRRYTPGSIHERLYSFSRGPLKRWWKRLRGKIPVEMHHINVAQVKEIIADAGGQLIDARQAGSKRMTRTSYLYCAVRKPL